MGSSFFAKNTRSFMKTVSEGGKYYDGFIENKIVYKIYERTCS